MKLPVLDSRVPDRDASSDHDRSPASGWRSIAVRLRAAHWARLALVCALVYGLHIASRSTTAQHSSNQTLDLSLIQTIFPAATSIAPLPGNTPLWRVSDKKNEPLAIVATTSPDADYVVGYAGPNNVLLVLDDEQRVTRVKLINSSDTHEHVDRVRESLAFWEQFVGWQSGEPNAQAIDGVSGATLTSLAIAEAISVRLSGERPSLRFPDEVTLEEVQALLPEAHSLQPDPQRRAFTQVTDSSGQSIGTVLRTGPLVDSEIGYQGPTELLVILDTSDVIEKVRLRRSYDNEPYVRYTRQEASFWSHFIGRSLDELAGIDLAAEGIEGVSGATMTSLAVAETLREAAQRHIDAQAAAASTAKRSTRQWNWSAGEICTAIVSLLVIPWSFSRLRGRTRLRFLWQIGCIVILVGLSGNLISMALFAGWTRTGPVFYLAPGLAILVVVALVTPALSGRNVYCDHICPHGIAQQWIALGLRSLHQSRPTSRGWKASWQGMRWFLNASAVVIIGMSATYVLWRRPTQIAALEPFDTYAWRVGLSASLAVWIASLLFAIAQPMGYCRMACPTGKVFEYVRVKRAGWRVVASDMLLSVLTVGVWLAIFFSNWESTR